MMLEVMICMMLVAFASLFTVKLVSEKITLLKTVQSEYELISEIKNTLFLKLVRPNEKNLPNRLFTTHSSNIYTTPYEINPKSALKQFAQTTKLLSVAYQPNKHAPAEQKLIGIVAYTKTEDK
jgi:hypothetical protein